MGQNGGSAPLWEGELGAHLTQCGQGRGLPPYQVASIELFGHNRHGPKIGGLCPFGGGEAGPHPTQCAWAEAYVSTKLHLDPSSRVATTDMPKVWREGGCAPFGEGSWVLI